MKNKAIGKYAKAIYEDFISLHSRVQGRKKATKIEITDREVVKKILLEKECPNDIEITKDNKVYFIINHNNPEDFVNSMWANIDFRYTDKFDKKKELPSYIKKNCFGHYEVNYSLAKFEDLSSDIRRLTILLAESVLETISNSNDMSFEDKINNIHYSFCSKLFSSLKVKTMPQIKEPNPIDCYTYIEAIHSVEKVLEKENTLNQNNNQEKEIEM